MARRFGGIVNVNGTGSYAGKTPSTVIDSQPEAPQFIQTLVITFLSALGGAIVELFK